MTTSTTYDVAAARTAIQKIAHETPVVATPSLEALVGVPVSLKLESLQVTGSFKVRGAANRMLALSEDARARGVVAVSSGNHGRAVAHVAHLLDTPAVICVPNWVDPVKLAAMRESGAEVVLDGATYDEAEVRSLEIQRERDLTFIDPFDDPLVIAGQGTIGLELLEQVPEVDVVAVPLSGGGLIGGIAYALKTARPDVHVVGVSAARARVMFESLKIGHQISMTEEYTVANALTGGIGTTNKHTLSLVGEVVDEHVLVDEVDIRRAMAYAARELKIVVEGGGAVGIAAALTGKLRAGQHLAIVVSGGNVDQALLAEVLGESG